MHRDCNSLYRWACGMGNRGMKIKEWAMHLTTPRVYSGKRIFTVFTIGGYCSKIRKAIEKEKKNDRCDIYEFGYKFR